MSAGASFDGANTVVLYDELALDDSFSYAWRPPVANSASHQNRHSETNLRVLQACLALDDPMAGDKSDDPMPQTAELVRLEMKVNLLLDMVGRLLVQTQSRPDCARLRFNSRGAAWQWHDSSTSAPPMGDVGTFELYIHDSLVDPLRMSARVMRSTQPGLVELQFERGSDAVANLIDKFVFRRHRRRVADVRNPQRG